MNAQCIASDSHELMTINREIGSCFATCKMHSNHERHTAHTRTPHKLALIQSYSLYDPSYSITYANIIYNCDVWSDFIERRFHPNVNLLHFYFLMAGQGNSVTTQNRFKPLRR
jgi:hypothetical protein